MIRPIRIANDVFSRVRKMIRPIRSHRGVRVSRQNSRLLLQLAAPLRTHSARKVLLKDFFSLKKWKTFRKWSGIVSLVSLWFNENGREPAKQQRKGKNRTRRKLLLCFLSELLCLSFKLKLMLKPAILLKFTHFQLWIENKESGLLIVLGLPHILTVIYVFNKRFYWKADTSFSLSFCGKCVAANFSVFERFKIKKPPKWWMSQYVYNKHNTTWKVLCTVFTHSLFLYHKSNEWA